MLGLFVAQIGESCLAELGHLDEQHRLRPGSGSASSSSSPPPGCCARDFRAFVVNVRDGLRTPWSELAAEEHV